MSQLSLLAPKYNINRIISKATKRVMEDPQIAITELIANAWDAGATDVEIIWPDENNIFYIKDNGCGMSFEDFQDKWSNIGYDRQNISNSIEIEVNNKKIKRDVYGKNGLGKFSVFCFANKIEIETSKDGVFNVFEVEFNGYSGFAIKHISTGESDWTGTKIIALESKNIRCPEGEVVSYLSQRFFTSKFFTVKVNTVTINFDNIPDSCMDYNKSIDLDEGQLSIMIIKKNDKDTTIRWSGILWRIQGRAVGKPLSWKESGFGDIVDGRTDEGKSYIVIIDADILYPAMDGFYWDSIDTTTVEYKHVYDIVKKELETFFERYSSERKVQKIAAVKKTSALYFEELGFLSRQKIDSFIEEVVGVCPSLKVNDLNNIVKILSTLETSSGKFGILEKMAKFSTREWENLDQVLSDWTINMAKVVLDEIQGRLSLIERLRCKVDAPDTLEVQELQPLMEKCLWMFGPEFDSLEFTSNVAIASCYQKYMKIKCEVKTSKNRPDFTILPDASLGFYSTPSYGDDHEEKGVSRLLIIELKAPSVALGRDEKEQPFRYCDEFKAIGLIDGSTIVNAYVVGSKLQKSLSNEPQKEGNVTINIILFHTLLARAEKRLFKLRDKIHAAPFYKKIIELNPVG